MRYGNKQSRRDDMIIEKTITQYPTPKGWYITAITKICHPFGVK